MKHILLALLFPLLTPCMHAQDHLTVPDRADSVALYGLPADEGAGLTGANYRTFLFGHLLKGANAENDVAFLLLPEQGSPRALLLRTDGKFGRLTVRTIISNPWDDFNDGKQPRILEAVQSVELPFTDAIGHAIRRSLAQVRELPDSSASQGTAYYLLAPGDSTLWNAGKTVAPAGNTPLGLLTAYLTDVLDMPLDGDTSFTTNSLNALRFDEE